MQIELAEGKDVNIVHTENFVLNYYFEDILHTVGDYFEDILHTVGDNK